MAAPFDFARLRPLQYDLNSAQGAIAFQRMVEVFMEAVRNNSGDLRGHDADIAKFCSMVNEDSGWQLAVNVVPEFRLSQDYDTEREATLLNVILRALKHKRPRVQYNDPTTLTEKTILRKRHRDAVEYLETYGLGVEQATDAEMAAVEDDFQRVVNILEA